MLSERQQIHTLDHAIVLLAADQERLKAEIRQREQSILEDVEYLKTLPKWRTFLAYPDMWFAIRQCRKKIKFYNMRVNVIQSFIKQVKQLREELACDAQFNQSFGDD